MKACKICSRVYKQDSMNFCLDDGTPLHAYIPKYDSEAPTLVLDFKTQPLGNIPKVARREFLEERGTWKRRIVYPQLDGLGSEYIQWRINTLLRKKFFSPTETIDEAGEIDMSDTTTETIYKLKLINHSTLSVYLLDYSETESAAHPNHSFDGFTIDLKSGYEYLYEDLFKPDSDYKNIVPALMTSSLQKQAARNKEEFYPFDKRESFQFYITNKNLVIINVYKSHAVQSLAATIRLLDIKQIIHPEGPLGFSL
jgi:hypothetical protein